MGGSFAVVPTLGGGPTSEAPPLTAEVRGGVTLLCSRCWERQHGRAARCRRVSAAGVTQPCCSGRPHCAEIPTPLGSGRSPYATWMPCASRVWSKMRPYRHTAPVRGERQAELKTTATVWAPEDSLESAQDVRGAATFFLKRTAGVSKPIIKLWSAPAVPHEPSSQRYKNSTSHEQHWVAACDHRLRLPCGDGRAGQRLRLLAPRILES